MQQGPLTAAAGMPVGPGESTRAAPEATPLLYAETLGEYLRTHSETALYRASLLSRGFIEQGLGPEEIVGVHFEALQTATAGLRFREQARAAGDAHQFLLEVMIAYGVQYREYLELRLGERTRVAELAAARDRARAEEVETERRRLDLVAAERAAVLGQVADGVVIAGADGRVAYVNEAARRLHGVAGLGVPVEDYSDAFHLFTLDGRPFPIEELPLARAVRAGETVKAERWLIRRPDGSEVVAEGSAAPVDLPDGSRFGSVLVLRDVTAQFELEREKDQFLGSVSHDLKNPLTSIKATAQLLGRHIDRGRELGEAQVRGSVRTIERAADEMTEQLDEVLDVARARMGRPLDLVRRRTDLGALARAAVATHQAATDQHRITVDVEDGADQVGQWDAGRVRRVVNNLLSNAVRYSPEGGAISISVGREAGNRGTAGTGGTGGEQSEVGDETHQEARVVLRVRDEGLGIPAEDLPHVFERFRRGSNVSGHIGGTGIGLADVRLVVEEHGGTITVASVEGQGSEFVVTLPLDLGERAKSGGGNVEP